MAPPSTPDKFPPEEAFDTLVQIEIGSGENKRIFEVFKGLLSFYSGYFDRALNGNFTEARDGVVRLPAEDPSIFDLFRHWIHTRYFYESILEPHILLDFRTIAELWVFADAHAVPMLQNAACDVLLRKIAESGALPDRETIDYIWDNTVDSAKLRHLIGRIIERAEFHMALETGYMSRVSLGARAELIDVAVRRMTDTQPKGMLRWIRKAAKDEAGCKWHVHENDATCL